MSPHIRPTPPEYQERLARYYEEVKPLLAHMANLVLLYRHPVWVVGRVEGMEGVEVRLSHYVWVHADMEAVFVQLEATIVAIREDYFGSGSD